MKLVIATRLAQPEVGGFPDKCRIEDADNGMILWQTLFFGTNPNPVDPKSGAPWRKCYAQLAPGEYRYECVNSPKHGKCIALNTSSAHPFGGECRTTNINHNSATIKPGTYTAYAVQIHCGYRGGDKAPWRGSQACQTVDPDEWPHFISHFELGEKGIYKLVDESFIIT